MYHNPLFYKFLLTGQNAVYRHFSSAVAFVCTMETNGLIPDRSILFFGLPQILL